MSAATTASVEAPTTTVKATTSVRSFTTMEATASVGSFTMEATASVGSFTTMEATASVESFTTMKATASVGSFTAVETTTVNSRTEASVSRPSREKVTVVEARLKVVNKMRSAEEER